MLTDNRFLRLLESAGFAKEREIAFSHKQSYFMRMNRDAWDGPAL